MVRARRDIEALRDQLKTLEAQGRPHDVGPRFNLGWGEADGRLNGGLARHALHDVYAATTTHAPSAQAFALALALRAAGGRPLVWGVQTMAELEGGRLYGPGLRELGLDPRRVVLVEVKTIQALLAAGEEALTCGAVGAVLMTTWGEAKALNLTASRRLTMAASQGRTTALMVRLQAEPSPSAADSRWRVRAVPSRALEADAPGRPTFEAALLRHRLGGQPRSWIMEWNREDGRFEARGREALSGGLVSFPVDRSAEATGGLRRVG